MKKSTISKIILALVLIALIFSFAACGKKNDTSNNSGSSKVTQLDTPKLTVTGGTVTWGTVKGAGSFEYIITHADGTTTEGSTKDKKVIINEGDKIVVRAIPSDTKSFSASEYSVSQSYQKSIQSQLIDLVSSISSITDIITAVGANDTLSADVSIGGYFKKSANDAAQSVALGLQANASQSNPSAMINFKLNDKAYVSLGYKEGKLYIREPINKINTTEENANAFVVDVTALEPTIKELMKPVMAALAKAEIDLSTVTSAVSGILNGFDMDLRNMIDLDDSQENIVSLGVKIGLLSTGLSMLGTMQLPIDIPAIVDEAIGYINKGLGYLGKGELKVTVGNTEKALSWEVIGELINAASSAIETAKTAANKLSGEAKETALKAIKESLLKIVVTYDNKAMKGLSLVADLGVLGIGGIAYEAGLTIGLPVFAKGGNGVAIDTTGFTAQDLVIDLGGALQQKGLEADVQAVVRLSDGLANKNNKWGTVTVKANKNADYTATGYINANGAYVDFQGIYTLLGVIEQPAAFKYEFDENLIDKLNGFVAEKAAEWVAAINQPKTASAAAPRSWEEYDFDLDAIFASFSSIDSVCNYVYNNFVTIIDNSVAEKATAGQADLIKWAFEYEIGDTKAAAKNYALFYNANTTTFEGLWNNIKACHESGKAALEAATSAGNKVAGIQLKKDGDDNDLLDYIAKFVVIPTVDGDEVDWTETVAPNNTAALIAWLNWAFPTTNEYRDLVDKILGIRLDQIIEQGLYLEAIGGTGLAGTVRAAASSEDGADEYVKLSAGIDIKAGANHNVADIEANFVSFTDKNNEDKYLIAEAALAMREGVRDYGLSE